MMVSMVVEVWLLAAEVLAAFSLALKALLELFPLLPSAVFALFLFLEGPLLASMHPLFVTVLLLEHQSVGFFFAFLLLFLLPFKLGLLLAAQLSLSTALVLVGLGLVLG